MGENENFENYGIKDLLTSDASSTPESYIEVKTQINRQIQELQRMYDKTLQMKFSESTTRMDLLLLQQSIEKLKLALNKAFEGMDVKSSPEKNEEGNAESNS